MDAQTVALLGGVLFLLIAIVGGGFTVREIIMPSVPPWGRLACLVVGGLLVVPFFKAAVSSEPEASRAGAVLLPPASADPASANPAPPAAAADEATIYSEPESYVSDDGIRVSGLLASGPNQSPGVGDRITVRFSLENVGSEPVTFDETFVGARDPDGENVDFGDENEGRALAPGGAVTVKRSLVVDAPGTWEFFPCYILRPDNFCPDEWRSFQVFVR